MTRASTGRKEMMMMMMMMGAFKRWGTVQVHMRTRPAAQETNTGAGQNGGARYGWQTGDAGAFSSASPLFFRLGKLGRPRRPIDLNLRSCVGESNCRAAVTRRHYRITLHRVVSAQQAQTAVRQAGLVLNPFQSLFWLAQARGEGRVCLWHVQQALACAGGTYSCGALFPLHCDRCVCACLHVCMCYNLIVHGAKLPVGEHLVRLGDPLESSHVRRVCADVRMQPLGKLQVRAPDLALRGPLGDADRLIVRAVRVCPQRAGQRSACRPRAAQRRGAG